MNTPVVYLFYKRIEVVSKTFLQIKRAKPNKLYLFSDGAATESDSIDLVKTRNFVDSMIDWDCEVRRYYLDKNIGVWKIYLHVLDEVFKYEDRLIYLEDDILASLSFFRFCDELLEKYKDDDQVFIVGGMSGLGPTLKSGHPSYIYTYGVSAWGHAIWKRTYLKFARDLSFLSNEYYYRAIKSNLEYHKQTKWVEIMIHNWKKPDNPFNNGMEFYLMGLSQYILYNAVGILPSLNLIKNIGDASGSEHSDESKLLSKSQRKIFNYPIYEIDFPLTHPEFRIIDHTPYLSSRKSNLVIKLISIANKVERIIRIFIFGGPKYFIYKSKKKLKYLRYEKEKKQVFKKFTEDNDFTNLNSLLSNYSNEDRC
jgi:hypothetical protein